MRIKRLTLIFSAALALSLSGCASHKEITAPCKRPAGLTSYAGQSAKQPTPAADALVTLAGETGGCSPLYPVNVSADEAMPQRPETLVP